MKKCSIYVICLLLGFSMAAVAQQDSSRHGGRWTAAGRADKMSDKLSRELGLTKQQDKQIYSINEDIIRRVDEVRNNKSFSSKEKMQRIKVLNEERSQRFKTVLSVNQYRKWNDWELKKKEKLEAKMEKKRQLKTPAAE